MRSRKLFTIALCLAVLAAAYGCRRKDASPVIASFDGRTITEADFKVMAQRLPDELKPGLLKNRREYLEEMISEHYLEKEAKRRGFDRHPDVVELVEMAKRKLMAAKLLTAEIDTRSAVTEEEARKYYESRKDAFMTPLQLRAQQILFAGEEEAAAVKRQIEAGLDFAEAAKKHSRDILTAAKGGDIGYFQKGMLLPAFEERAFAAKLNEVSGPFKTDYGWHLMRVTERKEPALREFTLVRPMIERELAGAKKGKLYEALTAKLRKGQTITVDEKRLNELDLGVKNREGLKIEPVE